MVMNDMNISPLDQISLKEHMPVFAILPLVTTFF